MTPTAEPAQTPSAAITDQVVPGQTLEMALRRAASWVARGMPGYGAKLLAGTEGRLRYRSARSDLSADLRGGETVYVDLCTRNERVFVTRVRGDFKVTASADLPSHLVEPAR